MSLKLIQRGKIWHYAGTVAGRRLRGSTKATEKAHAERVKTEIESRAWKCRFDGPGAGLTMAQVFTAYLDADKSQRFLLRLVEYWKDTLVENIRPETIRQAAKKIYPDAKEPTWNRQVIKPTQAAINHAAELGWCQKISVKRYPENPEKKTPATVEWVRDFYHQAVNDELPHFGALCMFMFGTAARVGESCDLIWRDVDLTAGTAKLYLFKPTPWTRTANLPPDVVAALAKIPSNRNPDALVFDYAGRAAFADRGTMSASGRRSSD